MIRDVKMTLFDYHMILDTEGSLGHGGRDSGNQNSHGARPVHRIISMITWIRTSRQSIKNSQMMACVDPLKAGLE